MFNCHSAPCPLIVVTAIITFRFLYRSPLDFKEGQINEDATVRHENASNLKAVVMKMRNCFIFVLPHSENWIKMIESKAMPFFITTASFLFRPQRLPPSHNRNGNKRVIQSHNFGGRKSQVEVFPVMQRCFSNGVCCFTSAVSPSWQSKGYENELSTRGKRCGIMMAKSSHEDWIKCSGTSAALSSLLFIKLF